MLTPDAVDRKAAKRRGRAVDPESKPKVVELRGAGAKPKFSASDSRKDGPSPGAPSDAEVKAELKEARAELAKFKAYLGTTAFLQTGPRARVLPDGTAVAPEDAPEPVKRIIQAGNAIAKFPYKWGGGHGAWRDDGYDCSGSVSFALAAAGLLERSAGLRRVHRLGRAGSGRVGHDLHEPRPHVHGRRRPSLRHERPRPRRHALAGGAPRHGRVHRAPPARLLAPRAGCDRISVTCGENPPQLLPSPLARGRTAHKTPRPIRDPRRPEDDSVYMRRRLVAALAAAVFLVVVIAVVAGGGDDDASDEPDVGVTTPTLNNTDSGDSTDTETTTDETDTETTPTPVTPPARRNRRHRRWHRGRRHCGRRHLWRHGRAGAAGARPAGTARNRPHQAAAGR